MTTKCNRNPDSFGELDDLKEQTAWPQESGNAAVDKGEREDDQDEEEDSFVTLCGRRFELDQEDSLTADLTALPDTESWQAVPPAPRFVSWPVLLHMLYFGGGGLFGLVFAGMGAFVLVILFSAGPIHFHLLLADMGQWVPVADATAPAPELVSSGPMRFSVNDEDVHRHRFRWTRADGSKGNGECYSGTILSQESPLALEQLKGQPDVVRIQGTSLSLMNIKSTLFALFFPSAFVAIGLLITFWGAPRRVRNARLLRDGATAKAVPVRVKTTGVRVNEQSVYRIEFRFLGDDGQECEVAVKTLHLERFSDEPYEVVYYDPLAPKRAVVPSLLPLGVKLAINEGYTARVLPLVLPILLSMIVAAELLLILVSFFSNYTVLELISLLP